MGGTIILLSILFVAFIILWAVGNRIPDHWEIEKKALIPTTPPFVFPLINEIQNWENWTAWYQDASSKMTTSYIGDKGIGASQIWKKGSLEGQSTITYSDFPNEVHYQLDINKGKFIIKATISLTLEQSGYTQMTWNTKLSCPEQAGPFLRYQALLLKNYFDSALDESLNNLQYQFQDEDEIIEED